MDRPDFVAAARHSARVRLLRRAIPWLCLAGFVFLGLRGLLLALPEAVGPVGISSLSIKDRKIVMENPRLSGFKRDGSSYVMNAQSAVQDLKNPAEVELSQMTARIQTGPEGWANLSGDKGFYDSKAEKLIVSGNVRMLTETGTEARLEDAHIDFKAGSITSDKPTEVKSAQGQVNSARMQMLDNGKRLIFEGGVQSVFVNRPAADPANAEGAAP